jgi:hypothetical protein
LGKATNAGLNPHITDFSLRQTPGNANVYAISANPRAHCTVVTAKARPPADVLLQENQEVLARFACQNDTFDAQAVTNGD